MFTENACNKDHILMILKTTLNVKPGCNHVKITKTAYYKSLFKNLNFMNDIKQGEIPGVPPQKQIEQFKKC